MDSYRYKIWINWLIGDFMNIAGVSTDYKIVSFDESIGQIQVKYDVIPYNVPLDLHPDEEGNLLEGEQLDIWIRNACPIGYVLRENAFKSGIKNLDAIRSLVVKTEEPEPEPEFPDILPDDVETMMRKILENKQ